IMSTTKIMAGAAAIVAFAGLGAALYEVRETQRATAAWAAAVHERDDMRARFAELEKRAQAAEQAAGDAGARGAALQKERAAAPPTPPATPRAVVSVGSTD